MEKVKEVINKVTHKDQTATHDTTTGTTGHNSGLTGTSGTHTHGTTGYGSNTTAGPHSSDMANRADPRVDSDLSGSHNTGASTFGSGAHSHGTTGTTGLGHNTHSDPSGPHNSRALNAADPRVDHDHDGSRNMGAAQYGAGAHNTGTTGTGFGSSGYTGSNNYSDPSGPHNSRALNAADPRVDHDHDGSRNMGAAQYGAGAHNTASGTSGFVHSTGGPAPRTDGPHKTDTANKLDPRVDSDRDGSRNLGAAQHGAGAHNTSSHDTYGTTGTHGTHGTTGTTTHGKPSLMDKLNPKKDADMDGKAGFMD